MANRKIKIVIFDLDGTLVDAYAAVTHSINYALKTLELPLISEAKVRRKVGWGEEHFVRSIVKPEDFSRTLALYRQHHRETLGTHVRFLPGAKEMVENLHRGQYKLAVASNRPTRFSKVILKALEIDQYFHYILCGDRVKKPKPSGEMLKTILQRFAFKPGEAVFVGDMTVDALCGKRARVKTVIVKTGSSTVKEIQQMEPFRIIGHIGKLRTILEELS
ncbi:MAG: HAD-IA family hydrolase [Candidatus Omnitrophica bacterium]|nr:HAD-IA family hydrolase [Candidatus Omnitrophota bacterium]MCB9747258.1 HAD-IA family hydrolase [Candidatus Omnitrophota bacterium]